MQRRLFLRNAACVGACATLLVPLTRAFADNAGTPDETVSMRFTRVSDVNAMAAGGTRVRVTPNALMSDATPLRVRAWFATDSGPQAFDIATFVRGNASQRLGFALDPQRLIGFQAATGKGLNDCETLATCSVHDIADLSLRPGQYRISLHRGGNAIATVDLEVSNAAA
jgi:hypothetical protein